MQQYVEELLLGVFRQRAAVEFDGSLRKVSLSGNRTHPANPEVPYLLKEPELFAYAFTTGVRDTRTGDGFSYTTHHRVGGIREPE
jgi:hypothetical protein